jgi:hypothetical protein
VFFIREDTESNRSSRPAYKKAFGKIKSMENYLASRQRSERSSHGRTYSDDEEDDNDNAVEAMSAKADACFAVQSSSISAPKEKKSKGKSRSFLSKLKKVYNSDYIFIQYFNSWEIFKYEEWRPSG